MAMKKEPKRCPCTTLKGTPCKNYRMQGGWVACYVHVMEGHRGAKPR